MKNNILYKESYLLGDVHGEWGCILRHLNSASLFDNEDRHKVCYIQVGDFNIGYNEIEKEFNKLKILNNNLLDKESDLYIIRGNHDDPHWFNVDNYVEYKNQLTNIFFVPDYTILNINFENFLFIGGAISIDRNYSKIHRLKYWEDEVVKFDFELVKNLRDIDRVICHTAPDFVEPIELSKIVYNFAKNDDLLLNDLRDERKNLANLVTTLMENNKIKTFAYGHFHNTYKFYHNDCEFLGLNICEFKRI